MNRSILKPLTSIGIVVALLVLAMAARNWLVPDSPLADGPPAPVGEIYAFAEASRDGTGKFYEGREIAQVMGHRGLFWLERDERESEEGVNQALEMMELKATDRIADIGAGSGYYSFKLAKLVPDGAVVAVDIQPEMLEFLERRKGDLGVVNIETHLGKVETIELPENTLDSVLLVDAYHEFSHPKEMLDSIYSALKPGGRLLLLEYRGEDKDVPIKPLHKMTEAQAIREVEKSGLRWKTTKDDLPWQHFMIFEKP